jgi:hypothetical protein
MAIFAAGGSFHCLRAGGEQNPLPLKVEGYDTPALGNSNPLWTESRDCCINMSNGWLSRSSVECQCDIID